MNIVITAADAGKTVLSLTRQDLGLSSAFLKRLKFSPGGILVNGEFATVRRVLCEGDVLSLAMEDTPDDVSPYITPSPLPLRILYEDNALTVIDKPPDMPAHPSLGHRSDTAANALAYRYSGKPYVFRPVNRLDRDTSGVMLTANTRQAAYRMALSMQSGAIRKMYLAVTDGIPDPSEGSVDGWMRRTGDSIITRENCPPDVSGARHAVTEYRRLAAADGHALLAVRPLTGRTHQIRVQLSGIGCPLTGDTLYGSASTLIGRHALHAAAVSFPQPEAGRVMTVRAALPEDMRSLISVLFGAETATTLEEEALTCF
jgi:23S rRNA pseudouridine1911/1915/1917 synthase